MGRYGPSSLMISSLKLCSIGAPRDQIFQMDEDDLAFFEEIYETEMLPEMKELHKEEFVQGAPRIEGCGEGEGTHRQKDEKIEKTSTESETKQERMERERDRPTPSLISRKTDSPPWKRSNKTPLALSDLKYGERKRGRS